MKVLLGLLSAMAMVVPISYAAPQALSSFSYTSFDDSENGAENCLTYAVLQVRQKEAKPLAHKLCGAGVSPKWIADKDGLIVFADIQGGSAAGWGLYRYSQTFDRVDMYNFNARQIVIEKSDARGVWLAVAYAVANPKGGYLPDRVETWYWAFDKEAPEKK